MRRNINNANSFSINETVNYVILGNPKALYGISKFRLLSPGKRESGYLSLNLCSACKQRACEIDSRGDGFQSLFHMTSKSRKIGITLALACLLLNMQFACYAQTAPDESAPDSIAVPRFALPSAGSIPGDSTVLESTQSPPVKAETKTIFSGFRRALKPAQSSSKTEAAGSAGDATVSSQKKPFVTGAADTKAKSTSGGAGSEKTLESEKQVSSVSSESSGLPKERSNASSATSQDLNKPAEPAAVVHSTSPRASIAAASGQTSSAVIKAGQVLAQEFMLPNGLKVIVQENHEFPVVSTLVFYRVGSRDEQTGATGLSHMVEHLMFQEVGNFKPGDIGSMIARVGGQFNGYTSDDFTTFFETLPSSRLEMALKIESDRMARTKFSANEVRQEIANIQKELEAESKDPQALLSKEVRAMMFMQHPYHNPTIGWKTDVEGLNADAAKSFYNRYFGPANATLVISGDVYMRQANQLVQKYFGSISGAEKASHVAVTEPMPRSERRINTKYDGNKELMQVAYRAPAMEDSDAPVMVVMEKLLNGGLTGRLKARLVDAKVCSSSQANYEIKKDPGLFTVSCTALPATYNAQTKILEGVDAVISQVRDKMPSDADVRRARNQAEFAYFAECDGPYRAGFHLGYFESLDKWQDNYSWAEKLRAVTPGDINRVARKYFSSDARVVAWISGSSAPKATPPAPPTPPKAVLPTRKDSNKVALQVNSEKGRIHDPGIVAKEKSYSRNLEHIKLTAYKDSDDSAAPNSPNNYLLAEESSETTSTSPTLSGTAQKSTAKPVKKTGIPAVIRDIPNALGNAVTGNIPGAVGNVGAALINLPGAIGDIGVAVGTTASALGKQIVALKPSGLESDSKFVSQRVLKNGLKVVIYESHVSPIVQISGSIQAGEAYSNKSKPGYSLLANSILSLGSTHRSRAQAQSLQDDLGISPGQMLKFDSNLETIDFASRCLSRDIGQELDMLADNLSAPLLDDANLEKAKGDAANSLKHNQDFVGKKVNRLLLQGLLDDNSPFCPSDPSDRAKTISQADLNETQKFFSGHITPAATTIVLAGDLNPEAAFAQMERSFSKWNNRGAHSQLKAKLRTQRVLRSSLPLKDSKKSNICFGQLIPMTESHPEYGSLLIADCILVNHPMISRFEQALSKNPALETAIANGEMTVRLEPLSNLTQWSMSLFLDPAAVQVSVRTIKNELKQIAKVGVTPEEFTEAKRYLLGSLPVRNQSTLGAVSSSMLDSYEHSDTINGYNAEIASVKLATVDSVNKVIRTSFRPEQSTIVIAGGGQSIKAARNPSEAEEKATLAPANPASPGGSQPVSSEKKQAPKAPAAPKPKESSPAKKSSKDDAKSVSKVKK